MKPVVISLFVIFLSMIPATAFGQREQGITEITFEEWSSWQGSMGKYVLNKDRSATLTVPNVTSDTPPTLIFRGRCYDFDRLARTMELQGFFKLKKRYASDDEDSNTVTISVVRNGIRRKVEDYGNVGPLNLWAMKQLLRAVTRQIKWEKPGVR